MRRLLYGLPLAAIPLFFSVPAALAQDQNPALAPLQNVSSGFPLEIVRRFEDVHVNEDGSFFNGSEFTYRILSQDGVTALQQMQFSFTQGFQNFQIITAYTLRADGTRIDVPRERIMMGHGATSLPGFQDENIIQVFFPNVEVGDQIVLRTLQTQSQPWYTGEYADSFGFTRSAKTEEARVRLSAPAGMEFQISATGLEGGVPERIGDQNVWEWSYRNDTPINFSGDSVAELDVDPHVAITTFSDYSEVAEAYASRSRGKAAVTPEIQEMADRLTEGIDDPREQVRVLYNWVSSQINYIAIFLGAGGFTPHEAHEVLSNRYGDCKDHVVLLEALLAAKGIESEPALIFLGSNYELSDAPSPFYFNHVITYVPSLDLYLDSTSRLAPFPTLPFSDAGKPVVRVTSGVRAVTPVAKAENTRVSVTTELNIADDGNASGNTTVSAAGASEAELRGLITSIPEGQESDFFGAMLGPGTAGTLNRFDPRDLSRPYSYEVSYAIPDAISLPGPGAVPPQLFYRPFSFTSIIGGTFPAERFADYVCLL